MFISVSKPTPDLSISLSQGSTPKNPKDHKGPSPGRRALLEPLRLPRPRNKNPAARLAERAAQGEERSRSGQAVQDFGPRVRFTNEPLSLSLSLSLPGQQEKSLFLYIYIYIYIYVYIYIYIFVIPYLLRNTC